MSKNIYRTAQGLLIDIDNLKLANESTTAVGNMKVNARGDDIAPDGQIVKTRQEKMKDHYRQIDPVVRYNPNKKR